jgi:hypothetical protein
MNFRAVVLTVGLAVLPMAISGAESAIIGTWKQVLSKSKYQPGPAPTIPSTVRIEAVEGGEKVSVEGIGADGQPARLLELHSDLRRQTRLSDRIALRRHRNAQADRCPQSGDQLFSEWKSISNFHTDRVAGRQDAHDDVERHERQRPSI